MKVFLLPAGENWVCDRFVSEWYEYNSDISSKSVINADILWIVAGWCWNKIPTQILKNKFVVLTIHHIFSKKFTDDKKSEFLYRDQFIDVYHVTCENTRDQIKSLTKKPIFVEPFWVNQNLWYNKDKINSRKKYGIDNDTYLIGSFQRDTEGSDLISPKLEKGPDLFCDYVEKENKSKSNIQVLLAGWRRQYVISRLQKANIKFYYYELPEFSILNDLYNCLDLYVVASRCEGGPQAIVECAASKTPIISTDVGIASEFLAKESILCDDWNATPNIEIPYEKIKPYLIPSGFEKFRNFLISGDLF